MNIFRKPTLLQIIEQQRRELDLSFIQAKLDLCQAEARVAMMAAQRDALEHAHSVAESSHAR